MKTELAEGDRIRRAAQWYSSTAAPAPRLALVLGSGLAGALDIAGPALVANFEEIPGLPGSSVAGHPGRLIVGRLSGLDIAVFEGRVHLFEGLAPRAHRLAAAFMAAIGVKAVLLTTACGGLAPNLRVGDFVVARDHLVYPLGGRARTLGVPRPGWGVAPSRHSRLGPGASRAASAACRGQSGRWSGAVYSRGLSEILEAACLECGARCARGVLALATGPCYETAAEARLLRMAGADVVSMSAAADALAAREEGLEVACLCCVTNKVGLWRRARADHQDVLRAASSSKETTSAVLGEFVRLAARRGMG